MVKKNSKLISGLLIGMGLIMVCLSAALCFHNYQESSSAGSQAMEDLPQVQAAIQAKLDSPTEPTEHINPYDVAQVEEAKEMTEVVIRGNAYIGYLTIPRFELDLPVMSTWSYSKLNVAPCRHMGSTKTDDIVIAAHNFPTHFGHLRDLKPGDQVGFADMDGERIAYVVDNITTVSPFALEEVKNSGYDLVLYTCTYGGANRIMVGCYREEAKE